MSAKTDNAIQSIQNIIAKGMTHKDDMYAVQGYCDMLTKEIAAIKAERDAWKATATQAAKHCMAVGVVCDFCQHDSNNCIGIPCPVVDEQVILTHFGAPEEDA
jgi:hypothetical protein